MQQYLTLLFNVFFDLDCKSPQNVFAYCCIYFSDFCVVSFFRFLPPRPPFKLFRWHHYMQTTESHYFHGLHQVFFLRSYWKSLQNKHDIPKDLRFSVGSDPQLGRATSLKLNFSQLNANSSPWSSAFSNREKDKKNINWLDHESTFLEIMGKGKRNVETIVDKWKVESARSGDGSTVNINCVPT